MSNTDHDTRMLNALRKVRFGSFNQRQRFVDDLLTNGVATERQRWWLTKLVYMHREQVMDKNAVVHASQWLDENKQPQGPEPAMAAEPAPPSPAPPAAEQPTLF
jgi:hypothetical protein